MKDTQRNGQLRRPHGLRGYGLEEVMDWKGHVLGNVTYEGFRVKKAIWQL